MKCLSCGIEAESGSACKLCLDIMEAEKLVKKLTKKQQLWRFLRENDICWFADYRGDKCHVKMWWFRNAPENKDGYIRKLGEELYELTGSGMWYCSGKYSRYPGWRLELPRYEDGKPSRQKK